MTDKIQQARRAAFEEWWKSSGLTKFQETAWMAFNAALDCVVIDSPGEFQGADSDGSHAWNACNRSFAEAIESTNLGIKVK